MKRTRIHVEDLRVDCRIGVWTHERNSTQQLRIDLTVEFDAGPAARRDDLSQTLNYADLAEEVTFILEEGHFLLLESAAWMIGQWALLAPPSGDARPPMRSVDLKLTKFGALPGSTLASVQTQLTTEDVEHGLQSESWGTVETVAETDRLGLYRVNIAPGQRQPAMGDPAGRGAALILSNGVLDMEKRPLPRSARSTWTRGGLPAHHNQGTSTATILYVVERPTTER